MPLTKVASSMLASGASGSGGSTGKNYISSYNNGSCNGDFENGSISGWSLCSVASITNGLPSTLTVGTAAQITPSLVSGSGQLAGQYSYQTVLNNSLASVALQGFCSDIFTIDAEDLAKVLTFKFYYQATSGASNGNFSGTSSNTFLVSIYAVNGAAAGTFLQPAGVYAMTQSSGPGYATGTFQTYSDTTQYRFVILCANNIAASSTMTVVWDDFQVGPQTAPIGSVTTDWANYTPQIIEGTTDRSSEFTSRLASYRRVGDTIEVNFLLTRNASASSGAGGNAYLTLPSGISLDSSVQYSSNGTFYISSSNNLQGTVQSAFSGSQSVAWFINQVGTTAYVYSAANWTPSLVIGGFFRFKVSGWSSNVQTSNDTDTRVVALSANATGGQTLSTGSATAITFSTAGVDTHGTFVSGASSQYTIPVSGIYSLNLPVYLTSSSGVSNLGGQASIIKNGSITIQGLVVGAGLQSSNNSNNIVIPLSAIVSLKAGDVLTTTVTANFSAGTTTVGNATIFSIQRLSGPSVIAATETVALKRTSTSPAQINSSVTTYVDFPNAEVDTHNGWVAPSGSYNAATGQWSGNNPFYRVPVSGLYYVSGLVGFQSAAFASTYNTITLHKNGSGFADGSNAGSATVTQYQTTASGIVRCVAGDTLGVLVFQDTGSARNLQNYGAPRTQLSIVRVGN